MSVAPAPQQAALLDVEPRPASSPAAGAELGAAVHALKLRTPNRQQLTLTVIDVEQLVPATHKARAIWHLTGLLDLTRFAQALCTSQGEAGRAAWDPRLLVSVWVYAYSEGISSAREIERMMQWEPGLMWLAGLEKINHHTLSDFRAHQREALEELFSKLLLLLEDEGLIKLQRVMHDGTKIEAFAGADSFRREPTVRSRLAEVRQQIRALDEESQEQSQRRRAAARKALQEKERRWEQALEELTGKIQAEKEEQEKAAARVSLTDPEARIMKHGDQAFGPAFNVQITTDAHQKAIVAVELNQCSSDSPALMDSLQQVQQRMGRLPKQVVVDGGYTSQDNIIEAAGQEIELIGPLPDEKKQTANALKSAGIAPEFAPDRFVRIAGTNTLRCPAGKELPYARQSQKNHSRYHQYQARAEDCAGCALKNQCCPKSHGKGRTVSELVSEHEAVKYFRQRMSEPASKQAYRQRGEVAEFPNAWIKEKIGLRKFRLRGLVKAKTEALWACVTYNILIWKRLRWIPLAA